MRSICRRMVGRYCRQVGTVGRQVLYTYRTFYIRTKQTLLSLFFPSFFSLWWSSSHYVFSIPNVSFPIPGFPFFSPASPSVSLDFSVEKFSTSELSLLLCFLLPHSSFSFTSSLTSTLLLPPYYFSPAAVATYFLFFLLGLFIFIPSLLQIYPLSVLILSQLLLFQFSSRALIQAPPTRTAPFPPLY